MALVVASLALVSCKETMIHSYLVISMVAGSMLVIAPLKMVYIKLPGNQGIANDKGTRRVVMNLVWSSQKLNSSLYFNKCLFNQHCSGIETAFMHWYKFFLELKQMWIFTL